MTKWQDADDTALNSAAHELLGALDVERED